jgi:DNA polymerase-3 subunit epsilon
MNWDKVVFFDLETTGLRAHEHAIVEIAAYCPKTKETFHRRVKPFRDIPVEASAIHGIYEQDVETEQTWSVIGESFVNYVLQNVGEKPIWCAYNGHRFDVPFLQMELLRLGMDPFTHRAIDPYPVMKRLFPEMPSRKQSLVFLELFGEEMQNAHNALGDLVALQRICEDDRVRELLGSTLKKFNNLKYP